MGYACSVCATPQRDGEHLAHHLAFTAMLHGDDHEAWLDEHVPDWAEMNPAELAERVVPHAESAEYPEVFEDTVDRGRPDLGVEFDGQDGHGGHAGHSGAAHGGDRHAIDPAALDPEAAAAVREARELTERMIDDAASDDPDDSDASDASDDPDDDSDR